MLLWAIAGLSIYNWQMHRRARGLAARHGQTEIEEWGDHLVIRSLAGTRHLAYEQIGKVISTDSHVFILFHDGPAIVPLRAFEDAEEMQAFGAEIDRRSEEAVT
ncbi:YcxB family protein [Mesorhizobium sp. ASY16-5R]|uniref:YcxB family protein n=1 Tax=Mesorhizobium sp. ASY16-5R TaxID=3445772 RepID=UPI003FA00421